MFCANLIDVEKSTDIVITLPEYEAFIEFVGQHIAGCSQEDHELCRLGFLCSMVDAQEQVDKITLAMRLEFGYLVLFRIPNMFEKAFGSMSYESFVGEIVDFVGENADDKELLSKILTNNVNNSVRAWE